MAETHLVHFIIGGKRFHVLYDVSPRDEYGGKRWVKRYDSEKPCDCPKEGGDDDHTAS